MNLILCNIEDSAFVQSSPAITILNSVSENTTSNCFLFFEFGILKNMKGDYYSSIMDYSKAIELKPDFALAYFNRAVTRFKMLEYQKSVDEDAFVWQDAKKNLQSDKNKNDHNLSDYDNVLKDFDRVIQSVPDFPYAWYNRGNVKCIIKDYEGAISDYTKAIDLKNDLAEAYFNRGLTYLYLKDNKSGCIDLSKAGELGMKDSYNIIKRYCNP